MELLQVRGALTNRRALRGITRIEPQLAACWSAPDAAERVGPWTITTTIDLHGRARATQIAPIAHAHAHATSELQACLERAAGHIQVDVPDTGGAVIEWSLSPNR